VVYFNHPKALRSAEAVVDFFATELALPESEVDNQRQKLKKEMNQVVHFNQSR
jgi:hypothetical protein